MSRTPNSEAKTEHTTRNVLDWLQKQDHKTLSEIIESTKKFDQDKREETLRTLRNEFSSICVGHDVSFADVYRHGMKKPGRRANGDAKPITE